MVSVVTEYSLFNTEIPFHRQSGGTMRGKSCHTTLLTAERRVQTGQKRDTGPSVGHKLVPETHQGLPMERQEG